jgi:hypothetical protein
MPQIDVSNGNFNYMRWVMDVQDGRYTYDAVQFSGIAFISTYKVNLIGGVNYLQPYPILCHVGDSMWQPAASTTAGALAVYDNRLWRAEPNGWRIAYFESDKFKLPDHNQGTLNYIGDGAAAEFRDSGQDFSEWETLSGLAKYRLFVANTDGSICWGYMGASNNAGQDIDIYQDDMVSGRGWGWFGPTTPFADGRTPGSYEVRPAWPLPFTLQGWSDYTTLDPTASIRAMEPFIGRLFIGCQDALWAYEAGRAYKVVNFAERASIENFAVMKALHGALWFNIEDTLYRYTSGGLLEEMVVDFNHQYPRSITAGKGCVYIATTREVDVYNCYLYRLDIETGAVQEMIDTDLLKPSSQFMDKGAVAVLTCGPEPVSELRASYRQRPKVVVGPVLTTLCASANCLAYLDFGFVDEVVSDDSLPTVATANNPLMHRIESIWMDLGYPAVDKFWERVRLTCKLPTAGQALVVYYRTVRGAAWTTLGTITTSDVASSGVAELDFPANTQSKAIQLRVGVQLTTANQSRTALITIEVDATLGLVGKRRIQFNAVVSDGMELLDLTVENSAAFVAASLYSLSGPRTIHTVALPFPPPVGHTTKARVELGPIGAVVPILAYSGLPSDSPGADISVVITEV